MREMPNLSVRMAEVTAAMMRPLIANLPQRVDDYNRRWESVVAVRHHYRFLPHSSSPVAAAAAAAAAEGNPV